MDEIDISIKQIQKSVNILKDSEIFTYEKYTASFGEGIEGVEPIKEEQWNRLISLKCQSEMVYSSHVRSRESIITKAAENIINLINNGVR